jgi:hypothetical protein
MEQAIAPEDNQVLLFLRTYPDMLRLNNSAVDIIQKLPYFA